MAEVPAAFDQTSGVPSMMGQDPTGDVRPLQVDSNGRLIVSETAGGSTVTALAGQTTGTATFTADATVDNTAGGVTVLASNASRKSAMIQNTGTANMRVSVGGTPTASTGIQVPPGQALVLSQPFISTATVKAIREGTSNTTCAVEEIA